MDTFLRKHEVDVSRCIAAVLFVYAFQHLIPVFVAAAEFGLTSEKLLKAPWWAQATYYGMFALPFLEVVLAVYLWKHRQLAYQSVLLLSGVGFILFLLLCILTPFFRVERITGVGMNIERPSASTQAFLFGYYALGAAAIVWLLRSPYSRQPYEKT